ncbi:hypothetical protein BN159_7717 [Streptomyces davaonensis JCM 4913]|uniref:Uncharacterized protein n=1 Tax=Streptomyces davaonensis (strain DSM 101723 / JCM 4913 / KCC S-0913 / 768) TaxID=1214101 RepID=K4R742_STRDJ|nr:hypothetical protein [Streptomyces davaonensis]CCK32096.1 hypothetical protein BN159_7717 [Streptomyces davaonensis JCM 4913]
MVARPRSGHRSCHEGIAIPARHPRTHIPSTAEAGAWADVLVRHQLLHTAVLAPTGQWLVQHHPYAPVRVLDGATAMVDLAAEIQHRIRTTRNHTR